MTINDKRPLEELVGDNRLIVQQRLGNIHCMTSVLGQAREARPKKARKLPVALRRGWAKCVMDTAQEYRGTYVSVMFRYELQPITVWGHGVRVQERR